MEERLLPSLGLGVGGCQPSEGLCRLPFSHNHPGSPHPPSVLRVTFKSRRRPAFPKRDATSGRSGCSLPVCVCGGGRLPISSRGLWSAAGLELGAFCTLARPWRSLGWAVDPQPPETELGPLLEKGKLGSRSSPAPASRQPPLCLQAGEGGKQRVPPPPLAGGTGRPPGLPWSPPASLSPPSGAASGSRHHAGSSRHPFSDLWALRKEKGAAPCHPEGAKPVLTGGEEGALTERAGQAQWKSGCCQSE